MNQDSLAALPDELLRDIVEHLDTARDVARLAAVSRRARHFVQRDGWTTFVRRRFASLQLPYVQPGQWDVLARKLTYLDRCWEQRAFALSQYTDIPVSRTGPRQANRGQSVAAATLIDARYLSSVDKDYVVWGHGEDLMVRTSKGLSKTNNAHRHWHRIPGADLDYAAGIGDVTALTVLDRGLGAQVAVGRANGDLAVLSLQEGERASSKLIVPKSPNSGDQPGAFLASPGQAAISWTEWQPQESMLAVCKSSSLLLYDLSTTTSSELRPIIHEDLSKDSAMHAPTFVRNAKFVGKNTIVCGLGASRDPLRCAQLTPAGLQWVEMAQNSRIKSVVATHRESVHDGKTTVRALQRVGGELSQSLLLSAWDDGTYRLTDIRTPSPYDAVYCDRLQPYDPGSSLLVYGTERFVAGSNAKPSILFFDFRQPKHYHWTSAADCSAEDPYPNPPGNGDAKKNGIDSQTRCGRCDHESGKQCVWHERSRSDYYRPDATLMIGEPKFDRIHSLAKSSDVSDTFWCGVRGAVFETRLMLADDTTIENVRRKAPLGWRVHRPEAKISFVETGLGVRDSDDWSDSQWAVNLTSYGFRFRGGKGHKRGDRRARLDTSVMQ